MPENRNPWEREPPPGEKRSSLGLWLWLGLIGGAGLLVWFLSTRFAYQSTDGDDWAHIIRLMGVLALVSSGLIFLRRINVRETARNIAIWVGIAAILLLGYSFRNEFTGFGDRIMGELLPHRAIETGDRELRINAGVDGHFHVVAHINGEPVKFLIDTGATDIVLNREAAERAGYDVGSLRFTRPYRTANGIGYGAPIRLDNIAIGPFGVADMPASVNDAPMSSSLLGISFLERLRSYEVRGSVMLLRWQATDSGPLAVPGAKPGQAAHGTPDSVRDAFVSDPQINIFGRHRSLIDPEMAPAKFLAIAVDFPNYCEISSRANQKGAHRTAQRRTTNSGHR